MTQKQKQIFFTALFVAAAGILLCWLFFFPESRDAVFSVLGKALSPFVIGGALAFALNLLLRPLERLWAYLFERKKQSVFALKRGVCLALSVMILIGFVLAVVLIVLPEVVETVNTTITTLQNASDDIRAWWGNFQAKLSLHISLPALELDTNGIVKRVLDVLKEQGLVVVGETVKMTASAVKTVTNILLGLVLSIYILAQKGVLARQSKKLLHALLREQTYTRLLEITALVERTFTSFLSGQLIEAVIIGVLCCIGMLIFGFPYAGAISVLIGFTALIPVFGSFIGTAVGAFLILLRNPIQAVWFVVFILVLQQLEGNLIYPRVVGKSVGLPAFWTFTAVTLGGSAFGVAGMLLGVPLMSVFYSLAREWVNNRLALKAQEKE